MTADTAGALIQEAGAEGIAVNLVQRGDGQWQASVRHHRNSGWSCATEPDLVSAIRVALIAHRRGDAEARQRYEAAPRYSATVAAGVDHDFDAEDCLG